jgi:peptidoglycan/LPS O-acetylase OafA/YrhL
MQVFKIRPAGFTEIRKKLLLKIIPITLIAVAAGIFISSRNSPAGPNIYPFLIPFLALVLFFAVYRAVNRQKALYDSYTLTFEHDLVKREQLNTPTIDIPFSDIRSVKKLANGSFLVQGKNHGDKIIIPVQIDDYAAVESMLNQVAGVETITGKPAFQKYQGIFTLLVVGSMVCVFTVTNKVIVTLSGAVVLAVMIWGFIEVRRNKNIDAKTKRASLYMLVVAAVVVVVVWAKLSGFKSGY